MLRLLWRLITSSASCSSAFLSQRSNIAPALRLDSLTLGEFWRRSGSLDLVGAHAVAALSTVSGSVLSDLQLNLLCLCSQATRVCFCSLMTKDIKADLLALVCQTGVLDQGVFPKLTLKDVYCLSCTCKSLQGLIMQHLPRLIKVRPRQLQTVCGLGHLLTSADAVGTQFCSQEVLHLVTTAWMSCCLCPDGRRLHPACVHTYVSASSASTSWAV